MRYSAVIFDLFGTLVYSFSIEEHRRALSDMAAALSIPERDFARMWSKTYHKRSRGAFPSIEANIEHICRSLKVEVSPAKIEAAAVMRTELTRRALTPRPDAVKTLSTLKASGRKIGLISNCSPETPSLWEKTPFAPLIDLPIFSCAVGYAKPEVRIYLLACERLEVRPEECLYIGDGADGELSGAKAAGMHPVRILAPYENPAREEWQGPTISELIELLSLANGPKGT
jgi:putative hydrolase of the HAD superfamily